MTTEKTQERLERCRKRVQENPDSPAAHYNLGLAYTHCGRVNPAEEAYRKALELDPDMVEAWVNLGGVLLLKWDFQGALEANSEALKRRADLLLAHYNSGQANLYLGNADGVVRCNQEVIKLDANHAAAHYYLAVGLLARDRTAEAREELARAMALGHRPTPEFLRGLEKAERAQLGNTVELSGNTTGEKAPDDAKEE
jgi:tetratricopeptide (TPR) repeat protein